MNVAGAAGQILVDAHAYVGPWPFRPTIADVDSLLRRLDRAAISRAVVSATEGVIYKDIGAANRLLRERIQGRRDRLLPLVTLNPLLAGWQNDWLRGRDELEPVGVRLLPAHHGYSLAAPEPRCLIETLAAEGVPLFVVMRLEDDRVQHPLARVTAPPIVEVADLLVAVPRARVILSGIRFAEVRALCDCLPGAGSAAVDISHLQHPLDALERLRALLPADRIWLGSGLPLLIPESAVYKVAMARLPDLERAAIYGGNALRELALPP